MWDLEEDDALFGYNLDVMRSWRSSLLRMNCINYNAALKFLNDWKSDYQIFKACFDLDDNLLKDKYRSFGCYFGWAAQKQESGAFTLSIWPFREVSRRGKQISFVFVVGLLLPYHESPAYFGVIGSGGSLWLISVVACVLLQQHG